MCACAHVGAQALINWADWTHLKDSWISAYGLAMSDEMAASLVF